MTTTLIGAASGTISVSGDNEWFKVQLTAGTDYVFDAGFGSLPDPQVTVYDSSGNVVTTGVTIGNGASEISFEPTTSGTYFIGASSQAGNTGSVFVQEWTTALDYAGNTSTAGSLALNGSVTGNITATGQSDWFKVTLSADTEYLFTLGGNNGTGMSVAFYDANGNVIQTNNLGTLAVNAFETATAGTYYVAVSSQQNGGTGSYTLSESTATPDFLGTVDTKGTVTVGGSAATGTIAEPGQSDWFKVSLTAGTQYVLNVAPGTLGIGTVGLYDSNGNVVVSPTLNGGANGSSESSFTPTTSGTYFVEAAGFLGDTGTFSLSVTTAADDYADNSSTTGVLASGSPVKGVIEVPADSDWFKTTLTAGTQYLFDVTNGGLAGSTVSLYDSNGNLIESGTAGNPSGGAQIAYTPTSSGTFYVGASGQGSDTGSYTVSMSTTAASTVTSNIDTTGTISTAAKVSGTFSAAGESLWYKASLSAGTLYVFDATPGTLSDPEIVIYNATGTVIATGTTGGANGAAQIAFDPTTSGTFFVGVQSQSTKTGGFTLTETTTTEQYAGNVNTTGSLHAPQNPAVTDQTAAQTWTEGQSVNLTLPSDAFTDPNGLTLTYSASLAGGKALPSGLTFDPSTDSFSGTAPSVVETLSLVVTATDSLGLTNSETISVTIGAPIPAAVTSFATAENAATVGRGANGIPTFVINSAGSATVDGVVGFQNETFSGGNDAVVLSGPRSEYLVQIAENGTTQITDTADNQTVTVTGESYIVFNGGSAASSTSNGAPLYDQIYFVLSPADAQIAAIYAAALGREPDLAGLEYWEHQFAIGAVSMNDMAFDFLSSKEFQTLFPAAAASPDQGGPHDLAFVTQLYETVLGRAPDAAGEAYWLSVLQSGAVSRSEMLADFAISTENILNVTAVNGNGGWLVNASASGGYADTGFQESAVTVLTNAETSHFVNTNLIAMSGVTTTVTEGNLSLTSSGALTDSNSNDVIILSTPVPTVTATGTGLTIVGPSAGSATITDSAGDNTIHLYGSGNVVNYGVGDTITGYQPGNDHLTSNKSVVAIIYTPSVNAPLSAATLSTTATDYVLIGNVGGGTAAEIATAANAVFAPAGVAGESVTFIGQAGNDTAIYHWVNSTTAPTATVTAAELTATLTLVGVTAINLSAADFQAS